MDIRFTLAAVAHVPVFYWPWVWWQLFWLRGWAEAVGRDVLYEIAPNGRVLVVMLSDDKRDLRAWMRARAYQRPAHVDYCDNPAGDLDTSYFVLAMAAALERTGHLIRWVWVRVVARPVPPIQDSS